MPKPIAPPFLEEGRRLAAAREAAGFALGAFAERIDMTRQQYGKWENGKARTPRLKREGIAQALNTTVEAIWGAETKVPRETFSGPRLVREAPPFLYGSTPATPAAAIYYAVSRMMDTCAELSREAAKAADAENAKRPPKE